MKAEIRAAFDRAAGSYDSAAHVQRQVAADLAAGLVPSERRHLKILDGGCGTGHGSALLRAVFPDAILLALDFSLPMLAKLGDNTRLAVALPICGDLEAMPIANDMIDLYWSSLAFQWCSLVPALIEARRILRPGGQLRFATLTSRTFNELREAFAGIDENAHTHDFLPPESITRAVTEAGLLTGNVRRTEVVVTYPDLRSLLHDIKAVGANSVGSRRRAGMLGRKAWNAIEARYARHIRNGSLPATYDVISVVAWKTASLPGPFISGPQDGESPIES